LSNVKDKEVQLEVPARGIVCGNVLSISCSSCKLIEMMLGVPWLARGETKIAQRYAALVNQSVSFDSARPRKSNTKQLLAPTCRSKLEGMQMQDAYYQRTNWEMSLT
jgi:hypothetical protein